MCQPNKDKPKKKMKTLKGWNNCRNKNLAYLKPGETKTISNEIS
jgi:hypothetical protein